MPNKDLELSRLGYSQTIFTLGPIVYTAVPEHNGSPSPLPHWLAFTLFIFICIALTLAWLQSTCTEKYNKNKPHKTTPSY